MHTRTYTIYHMISHFLVADVLVSSPSSKKCVPTRKCQLSLLCKHQQVVLCVFCNGNDEAWALGMPGPNNMYPHVVAVWGDT